MSDTGDLHADASGDVAVGDLAPNFRLPATTGGEITLSTYRGTAAVVLFFVRAYGWMQCRAHVAQLGRLYPELQAAGAEVLIILGDTPERAARYGTTLHVPFPILSDPTEVVYHRFGLHKALLLIQRTASVVVDRTGTVRYLKRATNPGTWLQESQELVQVVRQLGWGDGVEPALIPIRIPISQHAYDSRTTEPLHRFKACDTVLVIRQLVAPIRPADLQVVAAVVP